MSRRQQIVDAIEVRMKAILTTAGYATNAGRHVFPWRITQLGDAEMPALCVYDSDCQIDYENTPVNIQGHRLEVHITAEVSGSTARTEVRNMIADVFKAVNTDLSWGGLAVDTDFVSHGINMEQGDRVIGAGIIKLEIYYRTPLGEI